GHRGGHRAPAGHGRAPLARARREDQRPGPRGPDAGAFHGNGHGPDHQAGTQGGAVAVRKGSPVTRMSRRIRGTQRGAALLAFMLILIAGSAALLLSRLDAHAYAGARNVASQRVLLDAKQALIRYAMMYPDLTGIPGTGPGLLPCPDFDGDGAADNCGTTTADKVQLGRLPYRN